MIDFKDATELVGVLSAGRKAYGQHYDVYAWWTPGDATRYRVSLIYVLPYTPAPVPSLNLLLVTAGRETISVEAPRGEENLWTPHRWLSCHGEHYAGWWAGLRPLLAALGWTPHGNRHPTYSPADANKIGELLT